MSAAPPPEAPPPEAGDFGRLTAALSETATADDLIHLVLTLIEFIRELMERQAVRRFEAGDLADAEADRLGDALAALDEQMDVLCARFGLDRAGLTLALGPLGRLR